MAGKAQHSLTCSHGKTVGLWGLSGHWAVSHGGRGDATKVKMFLLISSLHLFSDYFCPSGVLELLHWIPRLPQRNSRPWVNAKIVFFWGSNSWELLFCHLTDVTLKYFGFRTYALNDNTRLHQMNECESSTMQKTQNKLKTTKMTSRKYKLVSRFWPLHNFQKYKCQVWVVTTAPYN